MSSESGNGLLNVGVCGVGGEEVFPFRPFVAVEGTEMVMNASTRRDWKSFSRRICELLGNMSGNCAGLAEFKDAIEVVRPLAGLAGEERRVPKLAREIVRLRFRVSGGLLGSSTINSSDFRVETEFVDIRRLRL